MSDEKERKAKAIAALEKAKADLKAAEKRLTDYLAAQGIVLKLPDSLKQRGIERLMAATRKHGGAEAGITNYERSGAQARAACELGWIDGLEVDAVDTMHPRVVMWIARQINDIIAAAWELPGE